MFDMSWGEIMVIGGVALIVIGPKDLPKALRTVGQMTAKVRRMAGEFQSQFSEAMREAELQDVKKEMEGLSRDVTSATSGGFNPIQTIRDELKGAVETDPSKIAGTGDWNSIPPPAPIESSADLSIAGDAAKLAGTGDFGPLPDLPPALTEPPGTPTVDPATLNPDRPVGAALEGGAPLPSDVAAAPTSSAPDATVSQPVSPPPEKRA